MVLHELVKNLETEDLAYLKRVEEFGFFENSISKALPQTAIYHTVLDFLNEKTADKRPKKVALLGYDGARVDVLPNVLKAKSLSTATAKALKNPDLTTGGEFQSSVGSGVKKLMAGGGKAYLTFAGGLLGTETEQTTITAPGWASINTGVWANQHGVFDNNQPKSNDFKSFSLQAAEKFGLRSSFAASWSNYFTVNYLPEIEYAKAHPEIPIHFQQGEDDLAVFEFLKHCVTVGDPLESDVVFCSFEATDSNGHANGFTNLNYHYANGFRDEDELAGALIDTIQNRPSYKEENWLILITTDHGGFHFNHGGQTVEERTTWVVTNQEISEKYYQKDYNGFC